MDWQTVAQMQSNAKALRERPLRGSVMSQPSQPAPVLNEDLPLEQVSPEDFIPNPKSIAAAVAKGGAGLAGITSRDALREAMAYAQSLRGRQRDAVTAYATPGQKLHAFRVNELLRSGKPLSPEDAEGVGLISDALRKAPKTDTPLEVYRGSPNMVGRQPQFLSTTLDRSVADGYAYADEFGKVHQLQMPKGSPLLNPDINNWWEGEQELLLPMGVEVLNNRIILPK
jgi:hypothetical protein